MFLVAFDHPLLTELLGLPCVVLGIVLWQQLKRRFPVTLVCFLLGKMDALGEHLVLLDSDTCTYSEERQLSVRSLKLNLCV